MDPFFWFFCLYNYSGSFQCFPLGHEEASLILILWDRCHRSLALHVSAPPGVALDSQCQPGLAHLAGTSSGFSMLVMESCIIRLLILLANIGPLTLPQTLL